MEAALGIGRLQLWTIVHKHLQLRKLCARWVPKHLTPQQGLRRVEDCTALLNMHDADSEAFFRRLVTGDESWLHCYEPETKEQSKQWVDASTFFHFLKPLLSLTAGGSPTPATSPSVKCRSKQTLFICWGPGRFKLSDAQVWCI